MGIRLDPAALAQVRSLGERGDQTAAFLAAIVDALYSAEMTPSAEVANVITLTGQIKDQDGSPVAGVKSVLLRALKTAGSTGTMTVTTGTAKFGSGTAELWLETNAAGAFVVPVALDAAGDMLIQATLDNGAVEHIKLTFA